MSQLFSARCYNRDLHHFPDEVNVKRALMVTFVLLVTAGLESGTAQPPAARYDLVIRGGHVLDGAGNPWVAADVAVTADTIVAVGPALTGRGKREIDARGLVVSPGFIDIHTHARRGIFDVPTADNYVRQGVTTLFEGPDGGSPVPLKPFLDRIVSTRITPNWGMFIGQGSVREAVMGRVNRPATPGELDKMKELVREGMREGAFGLSSGLVYVPGIFTPPSEVESLAGVAGAMGGMYQSHMRNEAAGVLESVRETIAVGELGHMPTQVTHHKIIGTGNWGRSVDTLRLVTEARTRGVDVTIDQYPYTASATSISVLLPPWALEGTSAEAVARIKDPALRAKMKAAVVESMRLERGGGDASNVAVSSCRWDPTLAGKNLADITRARGAEPTLENAADTVLWIVEQGGAQGIFHAIDEGDLERILKAPETMIGSDGEVPVFGQASPHPRSYGTFVRVLGRYVRERHVITLADAVRRMTSFPAWRAGLHDRGLLRPGMKADIAIWDADRIGDTATYQQPHQYAVGVSRVIVNGDVVFEDGRMTAARPGRVLHGPAYVPQK
jgi:N-acyl-D-amino-acid deacylase